MGNETKYLTVTAQNGSRMLVNLDTVFEIAESEGGCAFMFTHGAVLLARDDFEPVALAIGHEIALSRDPEATDGGRAAAREPVEPGPMAMQPQPHPWRSRGVFAAVRP